MSLKYEPSSEPLHISARSTQGPSNLNQTCVFLMFFSGNVGDSRQKLTKAGKVLQGRAWGTPRRAFRGSERVCFLLLLLYYSQA